MLTIAHFELIQLLRNRSVLITSLLMPVAACVFFIRFREVFAEIGSLGYVAAVLVVTISAFSLYATTVTTLAARRQTLFLKRLRCTAAADWAILGGLVLPVSVIAALQLAVILVAFAAVSRPPADVALLGLAIGATLVMMLALGTATAGLTRSPEHAQVTALPVSLGVVAVASWIGITGTDSMTLLKRMLPGGAATELIVDAWNGAVSGTGSLLLLAPTLVWVAVAIALAGVLFRWEPRR